MSKIGYYRVKTLVEGGKELTLYKNGVEASTAVVKSLDQCSEDRIVKFLDSKGQYRFFVFNKYYDVQDSPKQIGSTNEFITSILTDKTNSKNIGYKNERQLSLSAEVTNDQLPYLPDIHFSPRVYLYIGNGTSDIDRDWVEVTVSSDNIVKRKKGNSGPITLRVTLPEWFTIKMI